MLQTWAKLDLVRSQQVLKQYHPKGPFFSESEIRFSNLLRKLLNDGAKRNRLPYLKSLLHLLLDYFNLRENLDFLAYLLVW